MKKFSFLALAAVGLLLGACTSDDAKVSPDEGKTAFDNAFIGIAIQLPSSNAATRANEDFEDGENDEFAVKDATLYIFKGATEAAATYVASYAIGTNFATDEGVNVTSTYSEATQIDNDLAGEILNSAETMNYYAYVIVNSNGQIGTLDNTVTFAEFSKREFDAFGSPVAAEKNIDNNSGLLMTNAPVSAAEGGTKAAPTAASNYSTLVKLDKTKIFSTAAAAKAAPAGCVYVERAAVKITVAAGTNPDPNSLGLVIDGWQIINYEPTYYNTRQIDPAWGALASDADPDVFTLWGGVKVTNEYRFVSYRAFAPMLGGTHADQPYRTFFAKDPHYNTEAVSGTTSVLQKTEAGDTWIDLGKSGYTTENTFDVANQKWQNTTMVTLRAKFNDGDAFYMVPGDDAYYTKANVQTKTAASITNVPAVKSAMKAACEELAGTTTDVYEGTITVSFTDPAAASNSIDYTASYAISIKTGSGSKTEDDLTAATKTALDDAIAAAKAAYTISYYAGGYAYYNVRIQHFGEYETPWSSTAPFQTVAPGTTTAQIYGTGADADKRFLGRYGVVRDNWYKLTIDAIKKIGTAEPTSVTGTGKDTPDDEIENFISVHVHIVPWVIRNQSVQF